MSSTQDKPAVPGSFEEGNLNASAMPQKRRHGISSGTTNTTNNPITNPRSLSQAHKEYFGKIEELQKWMQIGDLPDECFTVKSNSDLKLPETPWGLSNEHQLKTLTNARSMEVFDMINMMRQGLDLAKDAAEAGIMLKSAFETLSSDLRNKDKKNNELQHSLNKANKQLEANKKQTTQYRPEGIEEEPHQTQILHKSTQLKDPPRFSGNRDSKAKYEVWRYSVINKLQMNEDWYPESWQQVIYILSRLEGTASEHCLPRAVPEATRPFETASEVIDHLDHRFMDHDKKANNRRAYKALSQGRRPFAEFFSEFCLYAEQLNITEEQQIDDLEEKLNYALQNKLLGNQDRKTSLRGLQVWCEQTDNAIRAHSKREPTKAWSFPTAKKPSYQPSGTRIQQAAPTQPSKPYGQSKKGGKQDLCFTCGKPGHYSYDCPANDKAERIHEIGAEKSEEVPSAGEEDDEDPEEGKEEPSP